MKRDAYSYGIQARTLLLKIVSIMIEKKVELTNENYKNTELKASGILGWLMQLSSHQSIAENLSALTNLMINQINDRESTISYPNEDAELYLKESVKIWEENIDPHNLLILPRRLFDDYLDKEGIVKDYKEINRFLAGTLSGTVIKREEYLKKSQFMKLIMKGVLRDCVKNILTFNKLGIDNMMINLNKEANETAIVPFSHQI